MSLRDYKDAKQDDFNESVICILLNMEERISALEPNHNWCAGCSPDNCSGCGTAPVAYIAPQPDRTAELEAALKAARDGIDEFLVANDPTEFGCACDLSVGYLCGPCHADMQQESIDNLKAQLESAQKSSAHVWKQHEELFDALARFLDADIPLDRSDVDRAKKYLKQRHELSLAVLDCGYCLRCRDFICHCGEDV